MSVYRSCRDAPESFGNISMEVLSLHAVLTEVEEVVSAQDMSPTRQNNLMVISRGCEGVLKDIQALVLKYESLGTQSKRTWDRMKWGMNDIAELRSRLTSNTVLLTAFMRSVCPINQLIHSVVLMLTRSAQYLPSCG